MESFKRFKMKVSSVSPANCEGVLESTIAGVGKNEGVAALKDDIENLNDFLIIEDAGGQ